jgi:multidrug efflux pump subunit AcrA (membrane-fusion protein)
MCKNILSPPGSGGAEAELENARTRANLALEAQQQAIDQAKAAADSESEQAKLASEARLRKLQAAGAFGAVTPSTGFGAAPVGYRQLYGA